MIFEENYLDVLQNIEFGIVSVYREHPDLCDYEVMRALDAVIELYRAEARGHNPKTFHLPEKETRVFQSVQDMCEFRLGRKDLEDGIQATAMEKKMPDEIVACLRKIRKSVDRWNRQGGRQGYLQFVCQYVK